jgi:hypothetical protein
MMNEYFLSHGSHTSAADGRCAMEWVAYLAGEKHSDQPVCVSPVLRRYCIALNDRLGDEDRQKLRPYLARTIGTVGDGLDEQRIQMCREFLLHHTLPRHLDAAGRHEAAQRLRDLPADLTVEATRKAIGLARSEAWEARKAARARLAEKIRAELAKRGAVADAAAAAAAVAVAAAAAAAAADADADAAAAAAAAAVADAAAAAVADAAAAAAAVAVAVAAADAVADAAAAAVADAVAVADAAAAADAVAVAVAAKVGSKRWYEIRNAVYEAVYANYRERFRERNSEMLPAALELLDRMLPTEVIQLPAVGVETAERVCGVPVRA